ncbi:MAG: hypothetical protein JTJ24_05405, partial [Collinsella sp.]|nr:hypothetical protein [Collinsella sp.]
VCATEAELAAANALVVPLARQGWSFEAIWLAHGSELPFGLRTAYRYQEKGLLGVAAIEMPRKVRHLPKRRAGTPGRPRVDRSGREYADFEALPLAERARAVQGDSVEGLESNSTDVLSLHFLASVSVNTFFTISANAFPPIAPPLFRRPRHRGCAASG